MRALVPLAALAAAALALGACGSRQEETIVLPATPVISVGSRWAVVTSNYLRMRARPSEAAEVVEGLPRGTVVEVVGTSDTQTTVEGQKDYWYQLNIEGLRGWGFGAYLQLVESRAQAQAVAAELR
jgi:hypothetical protein